MKAVTLIDCTDALTFDVRAAKSYPDTPEGRAEAKQQFINWVIEVQDPKDPFSDKQLDDAWDEGKAEIGQGFIAVVFSY